MLSRGGVVCFPTDTLYGLSVDTSDEVALEHLYRIKGRPQELPLIVLVDSIEMVAAVARPPRDFDRIAGQFWPGPITFVLDARPGISARITGGRETVAVRWPVSDISIRIVRALGQPITSTSANRSGRLPCTSADAIAVELPEIDVIVDGGAVPDRGSSTLVDLTTIPPKILREGRVPGDEILRSLAELDLERAV